MYDYVACLVLSGIYLFVLFCMNRFKVYSVDVVPEFVGRNRPRAVPQPAHDNP